MENSSSTMYWTVGGILAAAVIIAVLIVAFPQITEKITGLMDTMISNATRKTTETAVNGFALLDAFRGLPLF